MTAPITRGWEETSSGTMAEGFGTRPNTGAATAATRIQIGRDGNEIDPPSGLRFRYRVIRPGNGTRFGDERTGPWRITIPSFPGRKKTDRIRVGLSDSILYPATR